MKAFQIQNLLRAGTVAAALVLGGVAAHAQPGPGHHAGPAMMAQGGLFGGHMDHVLDLVEDACDGLVESLKSQGNFPGKA